VVDALSQREEWEKEVSISLLSIPTSNWIAKLKHH
jgi:hypothetical protein